MFYQLPRLLSAFGSGPQLPLLTRVVMMSLKPLGSLLVLGVLGALALAVALSRSETFRAWFLQKLARVPVIGPLLHEYFLIQVCGDLALMLSQGVDLSRSLRTVVTGGSGWPPLDEALGKTLDEVLGESEPGHSHAAFRLVMECQNETGRALRVILHRSDFLQLDLQILDVFSRLHLNPHLLHGCLPFHPSSSTGSLTQFPEIVPRTTRGKSRSRLCSAAPPPTDADPGSSKPGRIALDSVQ